MISKQEAQQILEEWVPNKNLQKHMYAVAQAMSFYARKFGENEDKWWITGLLHDADYEKFPKEHPYHVVKYLEGKIDKDMADAILGHATYTGVVRESKLAKTLFAVDELTGFIVAVALIKPSKSLDEVDVISVKKRFKEKRFAAGVNREDIATGVKELNIDMDEHIQNVIDAMKDIRGVLGL